MDEDLSMGAPAAVGPTAFRVMPEWVCPERTDELRSSGQECGFRAQRAFLGIYLADFRFAGRLRKGISNVGPLANFHLQASLMRAFHFDRPGRKG